MKEMNAKELKQYIAELYNEYKRKKESFKKARDFIIGFLLVWWIDHKKKQLKTLGCIGQVDVIKRARRKNKDNQRTVAKWTAFQGGR